MSEKTALTLIHTIYIGFLSALMLYAIPDPFDDFIGFLGAGVIAWFVFLPVLVVITVSFAFFQNFFAAIVDIIKYWRS